MYRNLIELASSSIGLELGSNEDKLEFSSVGQRVFTMHTRAQLKNISTTLAQLEKFKIHI